MNNRINNSSNSNSKYDDIIHLSRPESKRPDRISMLGRAAQFSAFAALNGYEEAIDEEGRLTSKRQPLSDDDKQKLDTIIKKLAIGNSIEVVFFEEDLLKEGGEYISIRGDFKKLDEYTRKLVLTNVSENCRIFEIPIEDIYKIELVESDELTAKEK